jgi:fluoride exporter
MSVWSVVAVALGGALGTLGRIGADQATQDLPWGHDMATLVVNLIGAGALGFVLGHGVPRWSSALRDGVTWGLLGAYTTMSGVALIVSLGPWTFGIAYIALSVVTGVASVWWGYLAGRRWQKRHPKAAL